MRVFIIFVFFLGLKAVYSQESSEGLLISCPVGINQVESRQIISGFRLKNASPTSRFVPTYFNVPDSVKIVVEEAFSVWDKILISDVPINTHVYWEDMDFGILATAGSNKVYKNFTNAPYRDVWYPQALAEAIAGRKINGEDSDIVLRINSNISWHIGLYNPINTYDYDLLSVIVHEIAHGIGFLCSFDTDEEKNTAKWGVESLPFIYDKYLVDSGYKELTNEGEYQNSSQNLLSAIQGKEAYFKIDSGTYSHSYPRLHTPFIFNRGASLSHFSPSGYMMDYRDQIMLPSMARGVVTNTPGNATLGVLYQIGWALNGYELSREYPISGESNHLTVYPNPSNDIINVKVKGVNLNEADFDYSIIDELGREILYGKLDTPQISTANLSFGKYYLKVGEYITRFIRY